MNTVHFSPSGDVLVSGSDDRQIVLWDWFAKKELLSYCSGHESNVFQARVMPFSNDRSVVSCAADGQVNFYVYIDVCVCLSVHICWCIFVYAYVYVQCIWCIHTCVLCMHIWMCVCMIGPVCICM